MGDAPRVLVTICARGGSKGVPNKNTRHVLGRPLLAYAIDCALNCPAVGQLVVSTDSDEIAEVAEACGVAVPLRRPAEMASDTAAKIHAIRHATQFVEEHDGFYPDIVADLDVGAPPTATRRYRGLRKRTNRRFSARRCSDRLRGGSKPVL